MGGGKPYAAIEDNLTVLRVLDAYQAEAEVLVVEQIKSYGNVMGDSMIQTCVWIGRFIERWKNRFDLLPRKTIVTQLCNNSRAKDSNVRQALIDRWGGKASAIGSAKAPRTLYGFKSDMWSALAIAVAWTEIKQQNREQLERALQ
jgi:hypothetical protein